MFVKLRTFLLLLMMSASTAVNADDDGGRFSDEHESNVTSMTMVLQEYLYEIQQDTSKIEFRVDSPVGEVWVSFQDFKGRFAMLSSGVHNNPAIVDINAESLDTEAGFIGMLLKSESFFDVENFPSIHFAGSGFEWYNRTHGVLKGHMTIQNVTRPVAFYVELVNADIENKYSERITVKATTTIKRSEFGIYTLLPVVSDNVNLFMSIDALKKDTIDTTVSMM